MKEILYFEADYLDDLGNEVPGKAAIPFKDVVKKLNSLGFSVEKISTGSN